MLTGNLLSIDVSVIVLDEWQTVKTLIRCHILHHLIWVYTVCSGLFVPILMVITVISMILSTNEVTVSVLHFLSSEHVIGIIRNNKCDYGYVDNTLVLPCNTSLLL